MVGIGEFLFYVYEYYEKVIFCIVRDVFFEYKEKVSLRVSGIFIGLELW